jgi:hypothetical protein
VTRIARMGEEICTQISPENLEGTHHLDSLEVNIFVTQIVILQRIEYKCAD